MNYPLLKKVDLNLKHYIGNRSDVLKFILKQLAEYLKNNKIDENSRKIYSAIYNAIIYYQTVSELSIPGETTNKTFLENTIDDINDTYQYLSNKYNTPTHKVIKIKARVKSPVSAIKKILEKVDEYIEDNRDLSKLNESLRDFIGIRLIIDAPTEIKSQGKQAISNYRYEIINDLLEYKGIRNQLSRKPSNTDYQFIPVNTEHDPTKLQKIKQRAINKEFKFDPKQEGVFIPKTRPAFMEDYDIYCKDYSLYPKASLYQRLHICAYPYYSKGIYIPLLPNYINPPKSTIPALEYQICTTEEDDWAEHGKASHQTYKERSFHRLSTPLCIELDSQTDKIRLLRFDESFKNFYGYEFKDRFNIDYQDFLNIFNSKEQDYILAEKSKVIYDENTKEYDLVKYPKIIIPDDIDELKETLRKNKSIAYLEDFYETNHILDNSYDIQTNKKGNIKLKCLNYTKYLHNRLKDTLDIENLEPTR